MKKFYLFILILNFCSYSQTLIEVIDLPSDAYWNYAYGMVYENSKYWISSSSSTAGRGIFYAVNDEGNIVDTTIINYPGMRESQGLAFDGSSFWYVDRKISRCDIFKLTYDGNVLDSITSNQLFGSSVYLGGAGWDGTGLWVSVYYPNNMAAIYKVDVSSKSIVDTIFTFGEQPHGITVKGDTLFYVMDDNDGDIERVYAVDLVTKDTIFSFLVPDQGGNGQSPRGLAWDGSYFWLLAEPVGASSGRQLFKYDLSGSGSPGIDILTKNIEFGNVQIDSTATANISIYNNGTADLILDSAVISHPVFFFSDNFPVIIEPGTIKNLPLNFKPVASQTYSGYVRFYHNDPIYTYSEVTVKGNGIYTEPYLGLSSSSINFGGKRINSTSYKNLTLTNLGSEVLEIDSITVQTNNFYFEFLTTPFVLDSVESKTFRVWFKPNAYTSFNDTIRIFSNTSAGRAITEVPLSGVTTAFDSSLGSIVWQGQIPDNPATSFNEYHPRSMKKINDISGDGKEDVIIATENYWTIAYNGNSSGTADILWMFSSYKGSNNAGSVDYVQGLQIAEDLNGDGSQDVVIGTGGGNEFVYALDGKTGNLIWQFGDSINYENGDIMGLDVKRDWNDDGVPDVLVSASGNEFNGSGRFSVFLLDGRNGNIIWQINQAAQQKLKYMCASTDFGGAVGSRVGSFNEVIGFNRAGQIRWTFNTAQAPWTVIEIPDIGGSSSSDILVGDTGGNVYALSGEDGSLIWQRSIGTVFIEDARVISDINDSGTRDILISGIAPVIYVLEGSNGQIIWQAHTGGNILGISELGDLNGDFKPEVGTASLNNLLYVFESRQGDVLFSYAFGGGANGTAAEHLTPIGDVDGNQSFEFVAGSRDGRIIAFSGGLDGTIPVELNSFTASVNGTNVTLLWFTASELNNSGFDIERRKVDSENSGQWEKIGFVSGKGTTTSTSVYTYTDQGLLYGTYSYRLKQIDFDGTFEYSPEVEVTIGLPEKFTLEQNFPNPFNPSTTIRFSLPKEGNVRLSIYNVLAEEVAVLINDKLEAGYHEIQWNGTDMNNKVLPTGVYFYRIDAGDYVDVKKMLFIK